MYAIMRRVKSHAAIFSFGLALAAMLAGFGLVSGCKESPTGILASPGKPNDSVNDVVYLAGTFTNFDATRFIPSLSMALVSDYTWQQTVHLPAGQIGFKFVVAVIAGSWRAYTHAGQSGLTSPVALVDGGIGNEVMATIPTAGDWIFTFYEKGPRGSEGPTYTIEKKTHYTGAIAGVVEFSDLTAAPLPSATIEARRGGAITDTEVVAVAQSDTLTGAFALEGLQDGIYSVRMTRAGYRDSILTQVQIVNQSRVALTTVKLPRGALVSQWMSAVLTGGFTVPMWTPNAPATTMTLVGDYTWRITVQAPAGAIEFKFPLDGAWTNAYGLPSGGSPGLTGICGLGGGNGNLTATIPSAGLYSFTLHEQGYQGVTAQAWYEITPASASAPNR